MAANSNPTEFSIAEAADLSRWEIKTIISRPRCRTHTCFSVHSVLILRNVRMLKNQVPEAFPKSARIMDSKTDKELRMDRNSARYAIELLYEQFTAGYTVDEAEVKKQSELLHQVEWELGVNRRIVPSTVEQKKSREAKKRVCAIREGIDRREQQQVSHSSPADSPRVERTSSSSRGHAQSHVNRSTGRYARGQGPSSRIQTPASRQGYSIPRIQPTQQQQPRRDIGRYTLSAMPPARQESRRQESPAKLRSEHRRPEDARSALGSNRRSEISRRERTQSPDSDRKRTVRNGVHTRMK